MTPTTEARAAYGTRTPAATSRDRLWWAITALFIVIVMLGAGGWASYDALRSAQLDGVVRGYKNRAASCAVLAALTPDATRLSPPLPPVCLEPDVVRYYQPNR